MPACAEAGIVVGSAWESDILTKSVASGVAFAARSCSGLALLQRRHSFVAQPRAAEDIQRATHGKI